MIYTIQPESGSRSLADATDINPVTGIINFAPGEEVQQISLAILDDSIPELAETLLVELTIPSVEGVAISGARLGNDSTAIIVIGESDEPHGVLRIADASAMIAIAEDVPPENTALGQAQVRVDRTFGTIGAIRALWEILPVSDLALPSYVDLIFFGVRGADVTTVAPRPNTATPALRFSGQSGSVVTVPTQYHPANITNGFTIR